MTHTSGPEAGALMQGMDVFNRVGYNLIATVPWVCMLTWSAHVLVPCLGNMPCST